MIIVFLVVSEDTRESDTNVLRWDDCSAEWPYSVASTRKARDSTRQLEENEADRKSSSPFVRLSYSSSFHLVDRPSRSLRRTPKHLRVCRRFAVVFHLKRRSCTKEIFDLRRQTAREMKIGQCRITLFDQMEIIDQMSLVTLHDQWRRRIRIDG